MDVAGEAEVALRSLRGVWDEELVDEFDHAAQTATHAHLVRPGDDEFLVAGLLHDIAHAPALEAGVGEPHDGFARDWLTPRFGPRVAWLAGAHVEAKRYLAATDPGYAASLSQVSHLSLAQQGGASQAVDPRLSAHPWWPDALALRRCDDAAKVPGAVTVPLAHLLAATTRVARRHRGDDRW